MPLGESLTYESPIIRVKESDPAERFTARYPTFDEFTAHREALAGLHRKKDKPGDDEPAPNSFGFMLVNFEHTLPLLTGYSVNGITIEDFGWKESLKVDPRYMEVVAALGFELFRGATIEGDS